MVALHDLDLISVDIERGTWAEDSLPRYAKAFYLCLILIGTVILAKGWADYSEYQAGVSNDYEPLRGTLQLGWIPTNVTYPMQYFTIGVDVTRSRVSLEYAFTYAKAGLYVLQVLLPSQESA
jgi:hypothetical protein